MKTPTVQVTDGFAYWCDQRRFLTPKSKYVLTVLLPQSERCFTTPFDTEEQLIAALRMAAERLSGVK